MSYVFPFCLFLLIAFIMSNRKNKLALRKEIGAVLFFVFATALMQLLTEGYLYGTTLLEYYQTSAQYKTGGGILGGLLCNLCNMAFGLVGAYVILIIGIIISLVLITQRSFFGLLRNGGKRVYHKAQTTQSRRRLEPAATTMPKKQPKEPIERKPRNSVKEKKEKSEILKLDDIPVDKTVDAEDVFAIHRADPLPQELPISAPEPLPKKEEPILEITLPEENIQETSPKKRTPKIDKDDGVSDIVEEIAVHSSAEKKEYQFPPLSLLKKGGKVGGDTDLHLRETAIKLQDTLHNFGVNVTVTHISCGPTVTRYELQPEQGVKVSKIVGLTDDIKLNLAATDIRIEAPIPGKAAVGIEVPNSSNSTVMLRDLLQSDAFQSSKSKLAFAAGKDIAGKPVITDIAKMPHLLIAGATGSGKSVCINTLIMSVLYKANPDEVKLIMIDPKVVELSVYNGIPHLFIPVVTDPKKAAGALNWAVAEMTERYNKFAEYNVRDLKGYNKKVESVSSLEGEDKPEKMPQIIIIVDELADLMMVAPGEVEDAICRLAQLARAAGIHLIIATQRPSVNVITGLIKANMPSRIAFSVSSGVDSRTILDMHGAEKLLGKGDMLFYPQGYQKPARVQGAFVSDQEVGEVVKFLSEQNNAVSYNTEIEEKINQVQSASSPAAANSSSEEDSYFAEAGKFIIEKDKASIGMLQRVFKIGFNRAARIMDQLCKAGVVGEEEGTKPRKVLMTLEEFEHYIEEYL